MKKSKFKMAGTTEWRIPGFQSPQYGYQIKGHEKQNTIHTKKSKLEKNKGA